MRFLTLGEAALELRVVPETVKSYIKSGRLRGTKPGGTWLIEREDLELFIQRGQVKTRGGRYEAR
jgi:excisionase family DNA binding protein